VKVISSRKIKELRNLGEILYKLKCEWEIQVGGKKTGPRMRGND